MKIVKKYIINLSNNFEVSGDGENREVFKSLYFNHMPSKRELEKLMTKYKCRYVHVGRYFKRIV